MGVKCDQCPLTFRNKFNLKQHQLCVHSDLRPVICEFPDCKFRTKTNSSLRLHQRLHETDINLRKPHRCPFESCTYRATMKSTLRLHLSRKHSSIVSARVKKYQCLLCPSMFCTNQTLSTHIARHTAGCMLACSHCDYKSNRRIRLIHHLQNVHNLLDSTTFACEFPGCNLSTRHRASLQRHQKTHNPVPTVRHHVPCSYSGCNYRAATPYRLKMHIRAHHATNRLKNVSCPMCPRNFYDYQGLKSHLTRVHTKDKLQHCDKCEFSAHFPHDLRLHYQRAHVKEKLLKCESCHYSAYRKFDLKLHEMTVHSDQRRFKCDKTAAITKRTRRPTLRNTFCAMRRAERRSSRSLAQCQAVISGGDVENT